KLGAGIDRATQMGPLANVRRVETTADFVGDAEEKGARVLVRSDARHPEPGFFHSPVVLADIPISARIMTEEPFGPIASLNRFDDVDAAIVEANRLPFGLAAYCFTQNGRRQNRLGDEIEAGMIAINSTSVSAPDSPFGGVKDSGAGSEDGPEGIMAHLITKTIHMN
ncbi:aldehyde dehydrogenase family protein, partial [Croceicoccus sp. F390]